MKINLALAISGLLFLTACSTKPKTNLNPAEWLIGTWQCTSAEGISYETWAKASEQEYVGKSYMLAEKDTVVFENIRLVQEQDGLFYIPAVTDQNKGLPIRFAGTTFSANVFVFENPEHDFPQRISYTKIGADSLVAEISGKKDGQELKQSFPMKRVK